MNRASPIVTLAAALLLVGCGGGSDTSCSNDTDCNDGVYCNGAETCDTATKKCKAGTPPSCDDGVTCTVDLCDEAKKGCEHVADDSLCSDGETCSSTGCASPCPSCDDAIACTLDFCDALTGECRHIPDDAKCTGTQKCDTTGGCVEVCQQSDCTTSCTSAGFHSGNCADSGFCVCTPETTGTVSGKAQLLGHTDSSGISVSLYGSSVTPATTAADGSYTLATVPAGVYTVLFSKAKYHTEQRPGVVIGGEATALDPVTLRRIVTVDASHANETFNSLTFSPDSKNVVGSFTTAAGPVRFYSAPADGTGPATTIGYGFTLWGLTNTDAILYDATTRSLLRKRLGDASPVQLLVQPAPGRNLAKLWVGKYILYTLDTSPAEYYFIPSDGTSTSPTKFYTVVGTEFMYWQFASDTVTVYTTVVLASQVESVHIVTLATGNNEAWQPFAGMLVTPVGGATGMVWPNQDKTWMIGTGCAPPCSFWNYTRMFTRSLTGTDQSVPTTAESPSMTVVPVALADGTGWVFGDFAGSSGGNPSYNVWKTGSGIQPTQLLAAGAYGNVTVVGRALVYQTGAALAWVPNDGLAGGGTLEATYTGNYLVNSGTTNDTTRIFWWFPSGGNTYVRTAKLSEATVTTLATIPGTCTLGDFKNGGDTLFYVTNCAGVRALHSFMLPSTTDAPVEADNVASLVGVSSTAGRLVYRMVDGTTKSVKFDGTGTVQVSSYASGGTPVPLMLAANWILYWDAHTSYLRGSNLDGTVIDEPITECNAYSASDVFAPDYSSVWAPATICASGTTLQMAPAGNLP